MDKQDKINNLFRTAREQEPKTSFDETKERFLKSLDQFPSDEKPKNVSFFNFKKWRIMLSSIIIIAILTVALFNSGNEKTENKVKTTSKMEVKEKELVTQIKTNTSLLNSSEIIANKTEKTFNLSQTILTENNSSNEMIVFGPVRNKYQQIPFDDTLKKEVLLFPKLSAKDIKKNNLRKKEMLKEVDRIRKSKGHYRYIPSGSFKYKDHTISIQAFYMSNTEITNIEYRTFLYDLLIQGRKDDYLNAKVDQQQWNLLQGGGSKQMADYYFTHLAYDNFPVCNVSREGAEMYCTWLSEEVHKVEDIDLTKEKTGTWWDFRIPTRVEWVYAATSFGQNNTYSWGTDQAKNSSGNYLANCNQSRSILNEDLIKNSISYNPNGLGLYNMCGNVAEMVYNGEYSSSEKKMVWNTIKNGTAGGGWMDSADEIKISAEDKYKGIIDAHPNIGFRVVMTHLGREKKLLIK